MNKNDTVRRFYSQYMQQIFDAVGFNTVYSIYGNEIQLLQSCAARYIL